MALRDPVRGVARNNSMPMPAMYSTMDPEEFDRMAHEEDSDSHSHRSGRSARSQRSQRSMRSERSQRSMRSERSQRSQRSQRSSSQRRPTSNRRDKPLEADHQDDENRSHRSSRSSSSRRRHRSSPRANNATALGDLHESDVDDDGFPQPRHNDTNNKRQISRNNSNRRRNTADPDVLRKMMSSQHTESRKQAHRVVRPGSRHARTEERRGSGRSDRQKFSRSHSDRIQNNIRQLSSSQHKSRDGHRGGLGRIPSSSHDCRRSKSDSKKEKRRSHKDHDGSTSSHENMEGKIVSRLSSFEDDDNSDLSSSDSDLSSFSSSSSDSSVSSDSSFSSTDSEEFSDDSLSSNESSSHSRKKRRNSGGNNKERRKSANKQSRDALLAPRNGKHRHDRDGGHTPSNDDTNNKRKKRLFGRKRKDKDKKEERLDKTKDKKTHKKKDKEKKRGKSSTKDKSMDKDKSVDVDAGALGYGNDEPQDAPSVASSRRMGRRGSIAQTAGKMLKKLVKDKDKNGGGALGALGTDYESDVCESGLGYEPAAANDNASNPGADADLGYGDDSAATGRGSRRRVRRGSIVEMAGNWLGKKSDKGPAANEDPKNSNDDSLQSPESAFPEMTEKAGFQAQTAGAYLQAPKKVDDDDCVSVGSSRSKSSRSSHIRRIARRPSFCKLFSTKKTPKKDTAQLLDDGNDSDEGCADNALLF